MSIKIMTEVWDHAPVDQGTLLVLLALADSADERSRSCYPGIDGLAAKSRLSERQVQYCIQRLREIGVVVVTRNASPVKTNLYRITEIANWDKARDAIIAPHARKPDTQSDARRDAVDCVSDTQLVAPKPSVTVSIEPSVAREGDLFSASDTSTSAPPKPEKKTEDHFETFWKAYPKKAGKVQARRNFERAVAAGAKPEDIIAGAERYADATANTDPQHIKWAQGWLTDERWTERAAPEPYRHYGGHRRSAPWGEIVR